MKNRKISLTALIALTSLLAFSPMANGQEKKREKANDKPRPEARAKAGAPRDQLEKIAEELKLSAEQKDKLKTIFQEQNQELRALRQDTSLSQEDRKAKTQTIRQGANTKIKGILTPAQAEQWGKSRKEQAPEQGQRKKRREK